MGKSAGKWIKTLLFGKKHSKSKYSKNDKKGELKDPARDSSFIPDQLSDRGVEKGTCACQCDAVGVAYVDQGNDDEEARRQEAAEAEYDAILIDDRERSIEENNSDSAVSFQASLARGRSSDDVENGLSQPQNKAAFRMSALEDDVDFDDDVPSIEGSLEAHLTDSKFSPPEEPKLFETTIQPELKSHSDLILSKTNEASRAAASGEQNNGITTPASENVSAAKSSSPVTFSELGKGGYLKPLAAEDTNGKSDTVASPASGGPLVASTPAMSLTATFNNNTNPISTAVPAIFTSSVSVSDSVPSGTGSTPSATFGKITFGASETPKVSGETAIKFGASPDPSTNVSAASTIISPSSGSSFSSLTNFGSFGTPSSGNMTSSLSSSTSNPSANNSMGSLFGGASNSFAPAIGTVSQETSTRLNSFASNTSSSTSFAPSLSSAPVSSQVVPFGFNPSASSSDSGVVAPSSGSASSLFGVNPTAVSNGSAGGSSSFTTSSLFSFGASSSSSTINAVGLTGGATAPVFGAGLSSSGPASVTTGSISSAPSSTSVVGSIGGAAAPVFSLSDRGVEKGTCACQCDAVGVAYVFQGNDGEEARRQEAAEAEYDAILIDDRERSIEENTDTDPSTSYIIGPSKSNGADVSTFKLTPSMLHGQALGSIELLLNFHKFESGAGLLNTHHSTPQDQGKIDETSPPSDPKNNSDSAVSFEDDVENGLSQRQNKAAFRMSVLEDYVDSDDDVPSIGGSLAAHLTDSKEEPKFFEPIQPKLKSHSDLILSNTKGESPPPESHYEGEGSRRRHHMGEGSSRGHRRTRAETDESEMEEMNRRMDDLQVTVQELKEEQNTRWDEYTAHRLEDLQWRTDQSAHWANYYAHRQEDLHHRQEQREEDRAWRAQQMAHWDTYHANQQTEQEWRQEMYNARLAQFPQPPPQ